MLRTYAFGPEKVKAGSGRAGRLMRIQPPLAGAAAQEIAARMLAKGGG